MTSFVTRLAHHLPSHRRPSVLAYVIAIFETARSRRVLKRLESRMLEDIGVSQQDAKMESTRSIWDVPSHWTK